MGKTERQELASTIIIAVSCVTIINGGIWLFIKNNSYQSKPNENNISTPASSSQPISQPEPAKTICKDVTSIDYNWGNDVICTRPDGSKFYTDYSGGHANDPNFTRR